MYGLRYNIWEVSNRTGDSRHPAVFPLQLAKDHIRSWSNKGDIVLDPFLGSGTTAIACIQEHRNYIGIEKEEKYFKIAKERIDKCQLTLI